MPIRLINIQIIKSSKILLFEKKVIRIGLAKFSGNLKINQYFLIFKQVNLLENQK
jgi:hypothetical protein